MWPNELFSGQNIDNIFDHLLGVQHPTHIYRPDQHQKPNVALQAKKKKQLPKPHLKDQKLTTPPISSNVDQLCFGANICISWNVFLFSCSDQSDQNLGVGGSTGFTYHYKPHDQLRS